MKTHIQMKTTLVALATTFGYSALFGFRTDYSGHYIAGFGAVVVLMALGWRPAAAALGLIAFGILTEATVFRLAIFDPVDFYNQSLGACLAALCLAGRVSPKSAVPLGILGVLFILSGFALSYGSI